MKRLRSQLTLLLVLTALACPAVAGDLREQLAKRQYQEIQARGDAAIPELRALARNLDPSQAVTKEEELRLWTRKGRAVFALGHIGTPKALAELQTYLEKPVGTETERIFYQQTALEGLRVMVQQGRQRAEALQLVQKALAQPDLVTTAMDQLAQIGDRSSVALIRPIFERAEQLWLKNSAALALAQLGDTAVLPHLLSEADRLRDIVPGGIFFSETVYIGLSYLAGQSPAVRDRLRQELLQCAPVFGTAKGLYPVHRAAQGLLRADALTVDLLIKVLTLPADAGGVRFALDGLRHTHDAVRMRQLLDQTVNTPEVRAAWSKFGEKTAADLRAEAARPMLGPEMGHIILAE